MALSASLCGCGEKTEFYRVENGKFFKGDEQVNFIGANLWYGPVLASAGEGGDLERLRAELDSLKSLGITNLRVLAGADGPDGTPYKVAPTLQKEPGVYDEALLQGLDRFMAEVGKRGMSAVIYLNNTWEWSGGYGTYLEWAGEGKSPLPIPDGWKKFSGHISRFVLNDKAKALFNDHVGAMVSRVNSVTGIPYKDDPAIFSWQICNEPRCLSSSDSAKAVFAEWIGSVASTIKRIDPNHMVSTGSEGYYGCEADIALFEKIHSFPEIDYMNIHIWPYNWGWVKEDSLTEMLPQAKENTRKYIEDHLAVGSKYKKPVVLEEFGFPRDGFRFSKDTPTTARDAYYAYVFDLIRQERDKGGLFAGCNFWGWGGFAKQTPGHIYWEPGDDYTGDPAQEQQGLNSVFATDSTTVQIIKAENEKLR